MKTKNVNNESVNNESVNKSARVITQNSNEAQKILTANDIIAKFASDNAGLLKTNLGTRKASIYKENLFVGKTDKEKKYLRKVFRNMLLSLSETLVNEKNSDKLKKLIDNFNDFYMTCYVLNDYSISSVCQENLSENKKNILQKALHIVNVASKESN